MRAEYQGELRDLAQAAMRGDEMHLRLHASSLAALESADPQEAMATASILRTLIAAGEENLKAHQRAGLGK
jgi:hypothetical protein